MATYSHGAKWTRRARDVFVHARPHTQWQYKRVHAVHCDLQGQRCLHSTSVVSPSELRCRSCSIERRPLCCDRCVNDVINYTVEPGFAAPDGSTRLPMTCTLDKRSPPFCLVGPVKNCGPPLALSGATSISDVAYVMWPNQVEYQCRDGYQLDGEWGKVSDINNTNMFFLSACTLDGLSVLKSPCVRVMWYRTRRGFGNEFVIDVSCVWRLVAVLI